MTGSGALFWFAYPQPQRKDREPQPYLRDNEGARCLTSALMELGYRSKDTIINHPSAGPDVVPFDLSLFAKGDLILMTTRPPIHDLITSDRRVIARSFTALEKKLFEGPFARVFHCCARSQITLSDLAASVSPATKARQAMGFRLHGPAGYESYHSPHVREVTYFKRGNRLTAAFLIYMQEAWENGPGLLAIFGVGGRETLVWCRLLQTRYAHLLGTTSFVMAEMRSEVPKQPQTLDDFAKGWDVQILGTAPLGFLDDPAAAA